MRLKPQHLIWGVVGVALGSVLAYLATSDLPGKREQAGDVVTKTIGNAEARASTTFVITLQEGGDAAHEADHVFASIASPAIASASFDVKTLELEVDYDDALIERAEIRRLLLAAGYVEPALEDAVPARLSSDGISQELSVNVDDGLDPSLVRAKAGVRLRIVFGQGSDHLASITIAELGVQQDLSDGGATVELEDPRPGTYDIVCAEGYADGTLIVE